MLNKNWVGVIVGVAFVATSAHGAKEVADVSKNHVKKLRSNCKLRRNFIRLGECVQKKQKEDFDIRKNDQMQKIKDMKAAAVQKKVQKISEERNKQEEQNKQDQWIRMKALESLWEWRTYWGSFQEKKEIEGHIEWFAQKEKTKIGPDLVWQICEEYQKKDSRSPILLPTPFPHNGPWLGTLSDDGIKKILDHTDPQTGEKITYSDADLQELRLREKRDQIGHYRCEDNDLKYSVEQLCESGLPNSCPIRGYEVHPLLTQSGEMLLNTISASITLGHDVMVSFPQWSEIIKKVPEVEGYPFFKIRQWGKPGFNVILAFSLPKEELPQGAHDFSRVDFSIGSSQLKEDTLAEIKKLIEKKQTLVLSRELWEEFKNKYPKMLPENGGESHFSRKELEIFGFDGRPKIYVEYNSVEK